MGQISIVKDIEGTQPTLSPDNYFVLSANTNTELNFRYVYDLYVFNQKVFTGKLTPNPEGLGIVPVGEIIHDFAENAPIAYISNTTGGTNNFIYQTEHFSTPQQEEVINWTANFGEEHSTNIGDTPTPYTGIGTSIGDPAYPAGLQRSFLGTMGRNIFSNLQKLDTDKFFMKGYDGNFPSNQSLFLTNSPRIRDISSDEYFTLSAFNYILPSDTNPNGDYSYVYDAEYNFYDEDGVLISGYTYQNTKEFGGGPRDTCNEDYENYVLPTGETQSYWNIIHIAAGTKQLYIPSGTKYYTLQLKGVPSPPPPTPTPTTLPPGYTSWRLRSCCEPEDTIIAGIQSGFTGSVRVYNNNCYYADEPISGASFTIAGGSTHANCDACIDEYACRSIPSKGGGVPPTPTPTFTPTPPPDPSSYRSVCPDWDYSSEIFQFNIIEDCDNPYDTNQIIFKNRYGTWDYFSFRKKKVEQIDIQRERYNQFDISYGSSNPQKLSYNRGLTDYSTQIREIHTYNTGFINEPDMYYLEELFTSNDVYMIMDNGVPFPINIISNTFDKKTKGRGKEITNITIQFEFANNIKLLDK